ncbi:MAG: histone deacetylase 11 [Rhodothermales bacterium]|jgi:histone deacetylase 11
MRWATRGTVLAADAAMRHGFVINIGGGFHHAKPDDGEGFCIYSDIGLAVKHLRDTEQISDKDNVAYINLDAHQGNGVCHVFMHDRRLRIFDMYNGDIYPRCDRTAARRIDADFPLQSGCADEQYLEILREQLPQFLDGCAPAFAIYNAGMDIFADDPLGGLSISAAGIIERDVYTVGELRKRGIPSVMVLSGDTRSKATSLSRTP